MSESSTEALDSHRLQPLLAPHSAVIVGASNREGSFGKIAVETFLSRGFSGRVYAVNPGYDEIQGVPCYPSMAELPEVPDLAVLVVANARLEEELSNAARLGIRAAAVFGSTYLQQDDADNPLLSRLKAIARAAGMQVCGSNCLGFHNVRDRVHVTLTLPDVSLRPGPTVFISHSGTAYGELIDIEGHVGLNLAVSAGQEMVTTAADYLDYALTIPSTRCVALFLETIRDPEGFIAGLERARQQNVAVVILKVGRTQEAARLAVSHSGALVGNDDAYRALFARHGVVQVQTMAELVNAIQLLVYTKPLAEGGLAAILDSGGKRELLIDLAADSKLPIARISDKTSAILAQHLEPGLLPINPLDFWGSGYDWKNRFITNMVALAEDPDTALCVFSGFLGWSGIDTYCDVIIAAAKRTDTPLGVLTDFKRHTDQRSIARLNAVRIPVLVGEHSALSAIRAVMRYRNFCARPDEAPPPPSPPPVKERWVRRLEAGGTLDEAQSAALLADYGIPTPPMEVVDTQASLLAAANEFGYPLVLKTASGIAHKTDADGVVLNVKDEASLKLSYADLASRLGPRVLVTPFFAEPGVEMALGVLNDPIAGMLVMLGAGGTLVELLDDKACVLAPSNEYEVRTVIDALRIRPLLDGVRGAPALDINGLVDVAVRLSVLAADLRDVIGEIDINPVHVGAHGCVCLDALVVSLLDRVPSAVNDKTLT